MAGWGLTLCANGSAEEDMVLVDVEDPLTEVRRQELRRMTVNDQLRELRNRQQATEEKLLEQQRRLDEFSEELGHNRGFTPPRGGDIKPLRLSCSGKPRRVSIDHMEATEYELSHCMWDASLMLYVCRTTWVDKFILISGMGLNLTLQVLLLLIISMNMLENPFEENKVTRMLEWRVMTGQTDHYFNNHLGKSLNSMLCNGELWSFEQSEYEEMSEYLYSPIPGLWLSILAVILWVMTCMQELKASVVQLQAILHLPATDHDEEDDTDVRGIHPKQRWLAVFTLSVPRIIVLCVLSTVGCMFLAKTVSLNDIVLNAVALAFVLDVDECLCDVVLSQKLHNMLASMTPIQCEDGRHKSWGGMGPRDLVRYIFCISLIVISYVLFLNPFHAYVEAAASALCAGQQDFTWSGGQPGFGPQHEMVTVSRTTGDNWVFSCDTETQKQYMNDFYGVTYNTTKTIAQAVNPETDESRLKKVTYNTVLSHAFRGCPEGQTKSPGDEDPNSCRPMPEALIRVMKKEGIQLSQQEPPECQRLEAEKGSDSCTIIPRPACMWSWKSHWCEEETAVPGVHHQRACNGKTLGEECAEWASFGFDHPTKNCKAWEQCGEMPDCNFSVAGLLDLFVANISAFDENTSITENAIAEGISVGIAFYDARVTATVLPAPSGTSRLLQALANDTDWNSGWRGIRYEVENIPWTVKPNDVKALVPNMTKGVNSALEETLEVEDMVQSTRIAGEPGFLSQENLEETKRACWGKQINCAKCPVEELPTPDYCDSPPPYSGSGYSGSSSGSYSGGLGSSSSSSSSSLSKPSARTPTASSSSGLGTGSASGAKTGGAKTGGASSTGGVVGKQPVAGSSSDSSSSGSGGGGGATGGGGGPVDGGAGAQQPAGGGAAATTTTPSTGGGGGSDGGSGKGSAGGSGGGEPSGGGAGAGGGGGAGGAEPTTTTPGAGGGDPGGADAGAGGEGGAGGDGGAGGGGGEPTTTTANSGGAVPTPAPADPAGGGGGEPTTTTANGGGAVPTPAPVVGGGGEPTTTTANGGGEAAPEAAPAAAPAGDGAGEPTTTTQNSGGGAAPAVAPAGGGGGDPTTTTQNGGGGGGAVPAAAPVVGGDPTTTTANGGGVAPAPAAAPTAGIGDPTTTTENGGAVPAPAAEPMAAPTTTTAAAGAVPSPLAEPAVAPVTTTTEASAPAAAPVAAPEPTTTTAAEPSAEPVAEPVAEPAAAPLPAAVTTTTEAAVVPAPLPAAVTTTTEAAAVPAPEPAAAAEPVPEPAADPTTTTEAVAPEPAAEAPVPEPEESAAPAPEPAAEPTTTTAAAPAPGPAELTTTSEPPP